MQSKYKLVDFHLYCDKCKHKKLEASEEPCNECLGEPANEDSHKPIKFEEEE